MVKFGCPHRRWPVSFFLAVPPTMTIRPALPPVWLSLLLLLGCGSGRDEPVQEEDELIVTQVSGFPHTVHIFKPTSAQRALVVLHGGSGDTVSIAFQLGLNVSASLLSSSTINWDWLHAHNTMVVLPQGQHIDGALSTQATTWSNHSMVSGQDDLAFLQALAAKLRSDYGMSQLAVAGHSMGGMMVNRLWCESPTTFDSHVAFAGPASAYYLDHPEACQPGSQARPYLGIIGGKDGVMGTEGLWEADTWTIATPVVEAARQAFENPVTIPEWRQHQQRAAQLCAETPDLAGSSPTPGGAVWTACGGRLELRRIDEAEHALSSLQEVSGASLIDSIAAFITSH